MVSENLQTIRNCMITGIQENQSDEFLKRAEGDVHFFCEDGPAIQDLVEAAEKTGERQYLPLNITATVPSISPDPVAKFILTLSIKKSK